MSNNQPRILVTGASGQLGRLVITTLLKTVPPSQIIATARNPETIADFSARGVEVRAADYTRPETLEPAFAGVDHLLLISSSEIGQRLPQHCNVIAAAKKAGVKLLTYTSVLHADVSLLGLAEEHRQTEGEHDFYLSQTNEAAILLSDTDSVISRTDTIRLEVFG